MIGITLNWLMKYCFDRHPVQVITEEKKQKAAEKKRNEVQGDQSNK